MSGCHVTLHNLPRAGNRANQPPLSHRDGRGVGREGPRRLRDATHRPAPHAKSVRRPSRGAEPPRSIAMAQRPAATAPNESEPRTKRSAVSGCHAPPRQSPESPAITQTTTPCSHREGQLPGLRVPASNQGIDPPPMRSQYGDRPGEPSLPAPSPWTWEPEAPGRNRPQRIRAPNEAQRSERVPRPASQPPESWQSRKPASPSPIAMGEGSGVRAPAGCATQRIEPPHHVTSVRRPSKGAEPPSPSPWERGLRVRPRRASGRERLHRYRQVRCLVPRHVPVHRPPRRAVQPHEPRVNVQRRHR